MRQDQSFPAQVELLLHDKPVRLWRLISENETKCSNLEQNVSTKSQKVAGVRIVPQNKFAGRRVAELAKVFSEKETRGGCENKRNKGNSSGVGNDVSSLLLQLTPEIDIKRKTMLFVGEFHQFSLKKTKLWFQKKGARFAKKLTRNGLAAVRRRPSLLSRVCRSKRAGKL